MHCTRCISSIDLYIHNIMVYGGVLHTVTYYYIYVGQQNICQLGCIMPATVDCRHITHAKVCQHVYDCPGLHCTETVCNTCTVELRKDYHTLTHH